MTPYGRKSSPCSPTNSVSSQFLERPAAVVAGAPGGPAMLNHQLDPYTIVRPSASAAWARSLERATASSVPTLASRILPSHFTADQSRRPIGPWTTKRRPARTVSDWTQRACAESGSLPLNNAYRVAHWMEASREQPPRVVGGAVHRCTRAATRWFPRRPRDRSIPGQSGRLPEDRRACRRIIATGFPAEGALNQSRSWLPALAGTKRLPAHFQRQPRPSG